MTVEEATTVFGFDPASIGRGWGIAQRPDPQRQAGFEPGDLWVCMRGADRDDEVTGKANFKTTRVAERSEAHGTWRYHFFGPIEQGTLL